MTEATSRLRLIIDSSDVRRATGDLDRFGRESGEASRSTDSLEKSMRGLQNTVRALIGALAVREVLQFANAFQQAQNRLRLVTSSTEELIQVQSRLVGISQATFNSFSATADLYGRLARSTEELGVSQNELLRVTETINKTVALSGASAQSAQAALFQLGQGLSAGALRGEELNSVLEQTPELARAIATGLGVSIAQLRQLGQDGALTAEAVLGALKTQAEAVDAEFSRLKPTIGQISSVVGEAFSIALVEEFTDELDKTGDTILETQKAFERLGEIIGKVFAEAIGAFNEFIDYLERQNILRVDLKLFYEGKEVSQEQLSTEVLSAVEAFEIGVSLNQNDVEDIERRLGELRRDLVVERSLFEGSNEFRNALTPELAYAGLGARLAPIQQEIDNLSGVLSIAKDNLEKLSDETKKTGNNLEDASDAARKFAESLVEAQRKLIDRRFADTTVQGFGRVVETFDPQTQTLESALKALEEARAVAIAEATRRGGVDANTAERITEAYDDATQELIDKNSGNTDRIIRALRERPALEVAADSIRQIADSISGGINQALDALNDPNATLIQKLEGVSTGLGNAIRGAGDGFKGLAERFGSSLFDRLGDFFSSAGAVGQAIGAIAGLIQSIKSIFGSASSGGTFNPLTGEVSFERTSVSDERNQSRNQLGQTTVDIANQIADIIGADFREGVGIRIFIDRNDQLLASLRDLNTNAQLALPNGVTREDRGNTASPEVAVRQGVNLLIANALEGGDERLARYARAAAQADIETEDLVNGLNSLKTAFDLTAEPLSNVERQLQAIDDAVQPAIDALKAVGQSFDEITQIANEAARAVGEAFVRDIQDDILSFRNATLGDFKRLLDDQEQLIKDAQTLLERGAITPEEFDLVQVRNSLERENFFQGLSAEELESLGDFFGLIESSGGSVALILTQLQSAFSDFVDNVAETREELQAQADQLANAARTIFDTRDDILQRFPRQSGGELLNELRGQLGNLREQALAGDNTAFEKIPEVANQLVELARSIFGSTTQFAEQRDFALQVLDQTGGLAQSRADKLLTEIEALNTQVEVLNDIRDALESPDPAVELIQAQLNQGAVTNDLIRQLLEQYIALTAEARAGSITPTEAQGAAEGFFNAGGARSSGTPTVSIDKFDDSLVILSQVRQEIARGNAETARILQSILNEQKRAGATSALTG